MPKIDRISRINELLRREIAEYVEKECPRSPKSLLTVSEVKTAPDLRVAKVFISIFGGDAHEKNKAIEMLRERRTEVQARISKNMILKYTPVLSFHLDERIEKGDRVLQIISELEKE